MMGDVYKELDEGKAELEKLKEECKIKTEVSESLRRQYNDSQVKFQQAKLQIEKQEKDLNVKSEEVAELRKVYEEMKSKLQETESNLKQASYASEKIRIDSGEKVRRLEGENRKLVAALEEATGRNDDLEQKAQACDEEMKVLKAWLSELQRKCAEAEEKARVGKELRYREDVILKLEEQSMSVQDQLKWKKEQFQHLEEAHRRLQDQFQLKTKEWASEKSAMLEEMTALQSRLESWIRISESLESRLKMCNQALAHEESRRKLMDVQLSESKQCFDNVLAEYEEAKAKIENLSSKHDEDIAGLRNSLGMKEVLLKEMEYNVTHLEQENKELLGIVKELQEAQISKRRVDPSISKLRNKLKDLEQAHSECSRTLMEREADWNSRMRKLIAEMKSYESDIKRQSEEMQQLKIQLDDCQSAVEVSGEETSILFMVLKAELSDAYSKLFNLEAQSEAAGKERKEKILGFAECLSAEDYSSSKSEVCLKQAREEIASLKQKLESLKRLEERSCRLEYALEDHKKMLHESAEGRVHSEEQVSQMRNAFTNVSAALEKSKSDLAAKINEVSQVGLELQLWKSKAESYRTCLEKSQEVCPKMETSILEQVEIEKAVKKENENIQVKLEEQKQTMNHLQQTIALLNQTLEQKETATMDIGKEVTKALEKEVYLVEMLNEKDTEIRSLQKELKAMENQSVRNGTVAADLHQKVASLKQNLEQNEAATKDLEEEVAKALKKEESLLQKLKGRDTEVASLQKQMNDMEEQAVRRAMAAESVMLEAQRKYECEREGLHKIIQERDETIKNMLSEFDVLKEQSASQAAAAAESARVKAESNSSVEKEELSRIIASERDARISLLQDFTSLEQKFMDLSLFTLSQEVENLVQIAALQEALRTSELNMNTQMERKNETIGILEMEISILRKKIVLQEDCLLRSNESIKELDALAEAKKLEMEKLVYETREQQLMLEAHLEEIKLQKEAARECICRLISERESLLMYIEGISGKIDEFCLQDVEFNSCLEKMLQSSDQDDEPMSDDVKSEKVREPVQKHAKKETELSFTRSPLRERNR